MNGIEMIRDEKSDLVCTDCQHDQWRIQSDTVERDGEWFIRVVCSSCHREHLIRVIPV
jgi:hypothetical protein